MKITYEKYSGFYYVELKEGVYTQYTFEELEAFGELIHQICQDEYNRALQEDLFGEGDCDGCKI